MRRGVGVDRYLTLARIEITHGTFSLGVPSRSCTASLHRNVTERMIERLRIYVLRIGQSRTLPVQKVKGLFLAPIS
jgi:hypothetical protein